MTKTNIQNRLRRVQGQLNKIQENIEKEDDCSEVITQFLAAKGAIAGAFEEYVKTSLDSCAKNDKEKMAKLVALLVRS